MDAVVPMSEDCNLFCFLEAGVGLSSISVSYLHSCDRLFHVDRNNLCIFACAHMCVWTYMKSVKQDCVCMQGRCGFLQVQKLMN